MTGYAQRVATNLSVKKSGSFVVYMANHQRELGRTGAATTNTGPQWPVSLNEDRVKEFLKFVIQTPDEFKKMRRNGKLEEYLLFLDLVLYHFIPTNDWKKKGIKHKVRDLFTVSDEAMAMVLLENSAMDMLTYLEQGTDVIRIVPTRKSSKTKYTKSDHTRNNSNFLGWSLEGTRRYNVLCQEVTESRKATVRLDEMVLQKYQEMFPQRDDDEDDMDESMVHTIAGEDGDDDIVYEHIFTGYDCPDLPDSIQIGN